MTDHQIAEILDPNHEMEGWWAEPHWHCDICLREVASAFVRYDETHDGCGGKCVIVEADIPPLTTDRVAAFTHVTPVLLEAGWSVHEQPATPSVTTELFSGFEDRVIATFSGTYPAATTAAIAWLAEHDSERLRKAVEVRPC